MSDDFDPASKRYVNPESRKTGAIGTTLINSAWLFLIVFLLILLYILLEYVPNSVH